MRTLITLGVAILGLAAVPLAGGAEQTPRTLKFSRDVRPILAEHCFRCHGPDARERQGELRLDVEADALRDREGGPAVAPGSRQKSQLWQRLVATDPETRMPPPQSGTRLTAAERDTLGRWLDEGAVWEGHWAFAPLQRPTAPNVSAPAWPRHPLDQFVGAGLDAAGLRPSPEADRETLLRRVTLDLIGLPPTVEEMDAFLADPAPNAYLRVVDRLLADPRYGERMAWSWLEGARYADTSGYQNDGPRSMWRWRDWVIEAFNSGMPYDQFTIRQLAGDLLPGAQLADRIATGFNRNHRGNSEGGIIPEEYQVEYVVDRVDTMSTVWLGLTMNCARCHEHKYDPITQRDFYGLYAYFNNIPEFGRAIKEGNSPPFLAAPTPAQEEQLGQLQRQVELARRQWQVLEASLDGPQSAWESEIRTGLKVTPPTIPGALAHFSLDGNGSSDPSWKAVGGELRREPGVRGNGFVGDGKTWIEAGDVGDFGYLDDFSVSLWFKSSRDGRGTLLSRMVDEEQADGWYLQIHEGRLQVNLVKRWLDDSLRLETRDPIPVDRWCHLTVTYDGSRWATGVAVYLDGARVPLKTNLDLLNQTITVKEPLRIGGGNGPGGRWTGAVDEVTIYDRRLTPAEALRLASAESVDEIARIEGARRTPAQQARIRDAFLRRGPLEAARAAYEKLEQLEAQLQQFQANLPTVMVMEEMPVPRSTHILVRGEYNRPGEKVSAGVPAVLPPLPRQAPANRLGLAQWLVDPANPLTPRVAVNRLWQSHFGQGLVRSTENFGLQGDPPSHPELLDWLASELLASGTGAKWDVKHLQRQIVDSATYRQSSRLDPAPAVTAAGGAGSSSPVEIDRLLAKFPRGRLSAEMIRDQALAAAGLLVHQLGGPSVKVYQPADLWKDLATDTVYQQEHGAGLYRRSLYTYWKRTVAPPSMMTFDAAGREVCQVRASRTNTPLQALTLLNETTFVEAARVLAERVLREGGKTDAERLRFAVRLTTSRQPTPDELQILVRSLQRGREHFGQHSDQAASFLSVGEYPRPTDLPAVELAAYTTVSNLLLNLDEVLTRQ